MVNLLELGHIVDVLDGLAPKPVVNRALRHADLNRDMLRSGPGFIPYAPVAVTLEATARALGDRHLGIRVGQKFRYSAYDGYTEYVLSAPYLAAALVRARKALPLIHPGSQLMLRVHGDYLTIGYAGHIETVLGYRHIAEGALFVISQAFRHYLGQNWHPEWIEVTGDQHGAKSLLEEGMNSPLRTGAPYSALTVRKSDLAVRNPDPDLVKNAIPYGALVARMGGPPPQTTTQRVQQFLRSQIKDQALSQDSAAARLGVGTRTLQRALRCEGTTFRDLKTQFIMERSKALLMETPLNVNDVAKRLGYDEPNSFRRAFHGWTGVSPSQFRAQHKAEFFSRERARRG